MFRARYAILLDGGFVTKKLLQRFKRPPTADDIEKECERLKAISHVKDFELLRIYYYDAHPSTETVTKPISKSKLPLAKSNRFAVAQSLFSRLELKPHFALRMGEVSLSPMVWKLTEATTRALAKAPRALTDDDFTLDIGQKGVDMRIGMDMARLSLRELVRAVIVVTADSDFIPAFKFVRREGVQVILDPMGHNARNDLKAHSDIVL